MHLIKLFFLAGVFAGNLVSLLDAGVPSATWFPQSSGFPMPEDHLLVESVDELFDAVKKVPVGGTIALADGLYRIPRYLEITTDKVTLRSASGNRDGVILDGSDSRHGELIGITGCTGVMIADLTVQNVKWNGIKINADKGAQAVVIHNCVLHNIWQRGVKSPAVPEDRQEELSPRDCRVQYCLFYNDRPKRFSDDETEKPERFNGNYIGGIDVKNTLNWKITDNVFIGIQGRTREGRACIYISENGRGCIIERNIFIDSDIAVALGNPTLGYSPLQAIDCVVRNNLISRCPETGILACYTRDCRILINTIHDPESRMQRLVWAHRTNEGLALKGNLLIGPPMKIETQDPVIQDGNVRVSEWQDLPETSVAGQRMFVRGEVQLVIDFAHEPEVVKGVETKPLTPEVVAAMRKAHAGFKGQAGYVAQFGDSITYSMAFWSAMSWDRPERYLTADDGLAKTPKNQRWKDYIKGARDKGAKFANYSGWTVGQLLKSVDAVLARDKPVAAIIMIGTNDISGGKVPQGYASDLEAVVQKCIAAHCVPILNTIPPRRDRDEAVEAANEIIRKLALRLHLPLVDFHAACLQLRPGTTWDGTIISKDGVHPSGGKTNDYSMENMKGCGYALRNWVNFLAIRQLVLQVFED